MIPQEISKHIGQNIRLALPGGKLHRGKLSEVLEGTKTFGAYGESNVAETDRYIFVFEDGSTVETGTNPLIL